MGFVPIDKQSPADDLARHAAAVADEFARLEKAADDEDAYRILSRLVETLQAAVAAAGAQRVAMVRRIQDAGHLSLAQLGDKIGVSKARAADMVNAAKRADMASTAKQKEGP
jgi:hypothetical protein